MDWPHSNSNRVARCAPRLLSVEYLSVRYVVAETKCHRKIIVFEIRQCTSTTKKGFWLSHTHPKNTQAKSNAISYFAFFQCLKAVAVKSTVSFYSGVFCHIVIRSFSFHTHTHAQHLTRKERYFFFHSPFLIYDKVRQTKIYATNWKIGKFSIVRRKSKNRKREKTLENYNLWLHVSALELTVRKQLFDNLILCRNANARSVQPIFIVSRRVATQIHDTYTQIKKRDKSCIEFGINCTHIHTIDDLSLALSQCVVIDESKFQQQQK